MGIGIAAPAEKYAHSDMQPVDVVHDPSPLTMCVESMTGHNTVNNQ